MSISTVTTYTPPRPPYLRCGLRHVPMSTRARAPSTAGLSTPTRLRLLRFDGADAHPVLATPTWVARPSRCSASEGPLIWAPSPPPDCHGLRKCFHVARYAKIAPHRSEVWALLPGGGWQKHKTNPDIHTTRESAKPRGRHALSSNRTCCPNALDALCKARILGGAPTSCPPECRACMPATSDMQSSKHIRFRHATFKRI